MSACLGEILDALGAHAGAGELLGAVRSLRIERLASLERAGPQDLSFARDASRSRQLAQSRAACVVVPENLRPVAESRGACILVKHPDAWFAHLTRWWKARHPDQYPPVPPGVHASAVVHASAHIASTASVGPLCVVGAHSRIGEHTVLGARVVIGEHCHIGARCIIHPGAVIGADGFGFVRAGDAWCKVEQLGGVRIGDDVEIGANTCIDRGALDDTVIKDGAKLDNLIQIGHNVHIGAHTAMAGCTGVAGSTHIGAHCTIGGHASIIGHLHIADGVHIAAASTVSHSLRQSGAYAGVFPLDEKTRWEKNAATLRQLHQLRARIKTLEQHCLPPEPP